MKMTKTNRTYKIRIKHNIKLRAIFTQVNMNLIEKLIEKLIVNSESVIKYEIAFLKI